MLNIIGRINARIAANNAAILESQQRIDKATAENGYLASLMVPGMEGVLSELIGTPAVNTSDASREQRVKSGKSAWTNLTPEERSRRTANGRAAAAKAVLKSIAKQNAAMNQFIAEKMTRVNPQPRRSEVPDPILPHTPVVRLGFSHDKITAAINLVAKRPGQVARDLAPALVESGIATEKSATVLLSLLGTKGYVERRKFTGDACMPFRYYPVGKAPPSSGIGINSHIISGMPPVY